MLCKNKKTRTKPTIQNNKELQEYLHENKGGGLQQSLFYMLHSTKIQYHSLKTCMSTHTSSLWQLEQLRNQKFRGPEAWRSSIINHYELFLYAHAFRLFFLQVTMTNHRSNNVSTKTYSQNEAFLGNLSLVRSIVEQL
ncbi:hypothetical protein HPP92_027004 [Vanilla planifolia]|uniref:Uncharacterized protein n=1 Tax=Vanilla planifolia TaxID=51239 RepID=A0A835U6T0_VANPL|nr:hypothetical protein HPP92_027004 [Vanilla planifolia]